MEYTQDQIKFIQRKKPEFNLKPVPSLDGVFNSDECDSLFIK